MRWKKRKHYRVKTRFLLFPKTIDNETRWLEKATFLQTYRPDLGVFPWNDDRWLDTKEGVEYWLGVINS